MNPNRLSRQHILVHGVLCQPIEVIEKHAHILGTAQAVLTQSAKMAWSSMPRKVNASDAASRLRLVGGDRRRFILFTAPLRLHA
jgi:hypothetical protein